MLDAKYLAHPVIIPTEPIGSIRRLLRLIEAFSVTNADLMPEEIRDRILEAARYVPLEQLDTTDDCGFSPLSDETSTSRATAFPKIGAGVEGTRWLRKQLEMDDAA